MKPTPARRRGFIRFQNPSGRPTLSREEYIYWSDFLTKVLKLGTEFEQNLPSAKTQLKILSGPGDPSPCGRLLEGCRSDGCVHLETCLVERHPSLCLTRDTGRFLGDAFECPAKDATDREACQECPAWTLNCRGTDCAMFTPYCHFCPSFSRQGPAVPEEADIRRDADTIRAELAHKLQPSGFVGELGHSGALEVKKDGSLADGGGIEIPTVGRRVHWGSFYRMCQEMQAALLEHGAYVNERCGQHYHILAGYLPQGNRAPALTELEKPVPEIVLANFHQLTRRYELAMFWLMSAGTEMEHLTRWARFRQSVFAFSAMRKKMAAVAQELAEHVLCMNGAPRDGKYASVAYHLCRFNEEGNLATFHIENRIADASQSPAVIAAWGMLCYAFVLKAVRLSQYGVMETGTKDFLQRVREIQPRIIDGERREWGPYRKADTSELTTEDMQFLTESAQEMVNFLKPELSNLGPAYGILMSLARRPCSLRLIEGKSWADIEEDLLRETETRGPSDLEGQLYEAIDLAGVVECRNMEEWVEEAAAYLGANPAEVADTVQQMIQAGSCRWSSPIGAVIAK